MEFLFHTFFQKYIDLINLNLEKIRLKFCADMPWRGRHEISS